MEDSPRRALSRRAFLFAGCPALIAGTLFHSRLIEPFWPEITRKRIVLKKPLSTPLVIAHFTDLHAFGEMPLWHLENCFNITVQEKPDLICITGDLIDSRVPPGGWPSLVRLLRSLSAAAPVFACLGNHDGGRWASQHGGSPDANDLLRALKESKIRCLINEAEIVPLRGQKLVVAGTADLWSGAISFDEQSRSVLQEQAPVVMLAHNPDTKDEVAALPWDLMLCGHTHGGQLRYPLSNATPFYVVKDRRYLAGLYPYDNRWIYISRGLGSVKGIRVNCPPEISFLNLVAGEGREI